MNLTFLILMYNPTIGHMTNNMKIPFSYSQIQDSIKFSFLWIQSAQIHQCSILLEL